MTSAAPTILALQTDSAWAVIVVVSAVTLVLVGVLRRLINRPGGLASGLLLGLPLILPLVAAFAYRHPVLPEIAVLRPASLALARGPGRTLEHLLLLKDRHAHVVVPYALSASTGSWLLGIATVMSALMLLRRGLGSLAIRRLVRSCDAPQGDRAAALRAVTLALARRAGLRRTPDVLVLPRGTQGVFATAGGAGHILISRDLLGGLSPPELEAILAHEIAHLHAKDVRLVSAAGFLRDVVVWNPVAHLAYRHLTVDRELEADRRAADLTGAPLAVASSLLKMCELMRRRGSFVPQAALGFWPNRGRVSRRVRNLIAIADGGPSAPTMTCAPFVAAALLAAVLALQVGVKMAQEDHGALALVWGAPVSHTDVWTARTETWGIQKRTAAHRGPEAASPAPRSSRVDESDRPEPLARVTYADLEAARAVSEPDLDKWMRAVTRLAHRRGLSTAALRLQTRGWRVLPLFSEPDIGPFGVYRMEQQPLRPKLIQP